MGQVLNKQSAPVTQIADKKIGKPREELKDEKRVIELRKDIIEVLDKKFPNFDEKVEVNVFCQAVYETVEEICIKRGAMQYKLPTMDSLKQAFEKHNVNKKSLDKNKFQKIIEEVITIDRFHVGQGAKDMFLYIFGVPIVALFAKRMIPGPTAAIADDVFLPAVTSGTVYFLAKTNRL